MSIYKITQIKVMPVVSKLKCAVILAWYKTLKMLLKLTKSNFKAISNFPGGEFQPSRLSNCSSSSVISQHLPNNVYRSKNNFSSRNRPHALSSIAFEAEVVIKWTT